MVGQKSVSGVRRPKIKLLEYAVTHYSFALFFVYSKSLSDEIHDIRRRQNHPNIRSFGPQMTVHQIFTAIFQNMAHFQTCG